jgi:membrane complex biogenesis BtpA family protein
VERPVIAVIHLAPLPGAPRWDGSMKAVLERAQSEARALAGAGFDGLIVENFGDAPFYPGPVPAETVAALALAVERVRNAASVPVGVNVLRNDAAAALGIAVAAGASFIRVNVHTGAMLADQGWLEGRAHETLRLRSRLGLDVDILADVLVKHATAPPGVTAGDAARDAWQRGLADGLIITGAATGEPADAIDIQALRSAVPDAPLWIGSGLRPSSVADLLPRADGAIVGSSLRREGVAGQPLDSERVRTFIDAVRQARPTNSSAKERA